MTLVSLTLFSLGTETSICHGLLLLQGFTARTPGKYEQAEQVLSTPVKTCSAHGFGGKNSVSQSLGTRPLFGDLTKAQWVRRRLKPEQSRE